MSHRHANKSISWITGKYFSKRGDSNWNFHAMIKDKKGSKIPLYLYQASSAPIKRHIKIIAEANPYNPKFREYFKHKENMSKTRLTLSTKVAG
jgi:RNA-directed DNA polymerase